MSLRAYLFSLIGGLILLLALSQLALMFWIERSLQDEVNEKARVYGEHLIELAVDRLDDRVVDTLNESAQTEKITRKKESSPTDKKVSEDNQAREATEQQSTAQVNVYAFNDNQVIKVETTTQDGQNPPARIITRQHITTDENGEMKVSKRILKKEFKTLIEKIHNENEENIEIKGADQTFVFRTPPNRHEQVWFKKNKSDKAQVLFNRIQIAIICVAIVGLIFAYWLSMRFNQPLKQLTLGFNKLADGDYKHQVKEQGVKEIRTTISQFNNMVQHLAELTEAEKQHKELSHLAELGEVSRGLAHALRNPIHTIGLSIEQLSENNLSDEQKQQLLATVQNKIQHLDKSIKALLTLTASGISRDEQVPLLAVVQDIILEYKSSMNKSINFEVDIANDLSLTGAESEIRSIIHTLVNNACEASSEGSTVKITGERTSDSISFSVLDQGAGLDEHIEKRLFQPHVSSKPEGAGMGLYIAKRIITLHYQGDLTLRNSGEKGCLANALFGVKHD